MAYRLPTKARQRPLQVEGFQVSRNTSNASCPKTPPSDDDLPARGHVLSVRRWSDTLDLNARGQAIWTGRSGMSGGAVDERVNVNRPSEAE